MKKILLLSIFLLNLLTLVSNIDMGNQMLAQNMGSEVTLYPCKTFDPTTGNDEWHFSTSPCDNELGGTCVSVCRTCGMQGDCESMKYHSHGTGYSGVDNSYRDGNTLPSPGGGVVGGGGGNSTSRRGPTPEQKAVAFLNKHAKSKSQGKCAKYVRLALEEEGINTTGHPVSACNYGPFLLKRGFETVSNSSKLEIGDIRVWNAWGKHVHGHIDMWNGHRWVSDYVEQNKYVSQSYRKFSSYKTYRRKK